MIKNKLKWFLAEDDGGGSGGGRSSVAEILGPPGQEPSGDGGEGEGEGEGEGDSTPTPPAAPAMVDAKALVAEFMAQQPKAVSGQNRPEPQRPLTPEEKAELQKQLNYWEATPEFLAKFGNLETQRDAIHEMRDGLTKQLVTIMQSLLSDRDTKFEERFTPLQQMVAERQEQERESRFNTTYPELATPQAKKIMGLVGQEIAAAGGFNGLDEKAAFSKLAKETEKYIQSFNPQFKLSGAATPPNPKTKSPTPPGGIPVTSNGGGGGGGGGGQQSASGLPKAVSLLPKIRS